MSDPEQPDLSRPEGLKPRAQMPALVTLLTLNFDAWVVGSAAAPDANLSLVRDFDVLIPMNRWHDAAAMLYNQTGGVPTLLRMNRLGGWKLTLSHDDKQVEVDIWPGDLSWLMLNHTARYAWHVRSNTRLCKLAPDET